MDLTTGALSEPPDSEGVSPDEITPDSILREFNAHLKASRAHFQDWRDEARELYDAVSGRQWDSADESLLLAQKRPMVTFNVMGKYLDAMQGLQINNRQDIKYAAREAGDLRANEALSGAVAWGRDLSAMLDDETDAFYDCVLTGMGWMEGFLDKDLDPGGVPAGERVDPLEMFPDPNARKRNFEDGRRVARVKWYTKDEYAEIVGELEETSDQPDLAQLTSEDEDQLTVIENLQDYGDNTPGSQPGTIRKRPIADFQWWRREDAFDVNAEGYGQQTFDAPAWGQLEPMLQAKGVQYKANKTRRRVYYRAMIAGGEVKRWGKSSWQSGFTFHAITGKRDRNKRSWFGIGRSILDPQRWVNKFFSTILYVMMTNAKGGVMAEEGAFVDQKKAEQNWANPAAITMMKAGAISGDKVRDKPQGAYPMGLDKLMEFSLNALPQTSGLNLELLGLADRVQAGVVEAQRKQSAMAIVAWAFDAMRRYYRSMGRMLAEYVIDYVPEGTLVLVNGEAGKQYVPLVKQQMSAKFDVIVDEAPTSVNQQERVWAVLQQIIPQLLQAGIKVPKEVITFAPLPEDLKQAWMKELQPDPQAQQQQQQQMMATLQQMLADAANKNASAKLDQAKAQQIMVELQSGPENKGALQQMQQQHDEKMQTMQSMVDSRLAELKMNRDAETKLMIAEMGLKSDERIAALQAMIDSRLEASRMAHESATAMAVAQITKPEPEPEDPNKPDPVALVTDAVNELKEAVKQMAKPKRTRIKRDANGDMAEVIQEST